MAEWKRLTLDKNIAFSKSFEIRNLLYNRGNKNGV